eukprot:1151057-Pelagomonas_calceolata.AAC.5
MYMRPASRTMRRWLHCQSSMSRAKCLCAPTCSRLMRSYMRPASRTMRVATSPGVIPWPGPGGRGGSLAYLHVACVNAAQHTWRASSAKCAAWQCAIWCASSARQQCKMHIGTWDGSAPYGVQAVRDSSTTQGVQAVQNGWHGSAARPPNAYRHTAWQCNIWCASSETS